MRKNCQFLYQYLIYLIEMDSFTTKNNQNADAKTQCLGSHEQK